MSLRVRAYSTIGTVLSCSAPNTVVAGEQFTVSGMLYKEGSGEPIPSARIELRIDGQYIDYDLTDVDGKYSFLVTINEEGDHVIEVSYGGGTCETGCIQSCTADCITSCTIGCITPCIASCTGSCTLSCIDECTAGCTGSCIESCTSSCISGCTASCITGCTSDCTVSCTVGCTASCIESCVASCTGYYT